MNTNYPNELIGFDGFQLKILNQKIKKIIDDNKIGFDYNNNLLRFFIYDLNVKIVICCDEIYDSILDTDFDYFKTINSYIDKAGRQITNTSSLTDCIFNFSEIVYLEEPDFSEYHFMFWDLITTDRSISKAISINKDSI